MTGDKSNSNSNQNSEGNMLGRAPVGRVDLGLEPNTNSALVPLPALSEVSTKDGDTITPWDMPLENNCEKKINYQNLQTTKK